MDHLTPKIPGVDELIDKEIIIKTNNLNSSPGPDGVPFAFYRGRLDSVDPIFQLPGWPLAAALS